MTLRVHVLPGLSPREALAASGDGPLPEPFRSRETRFYQLGRHAIWHALRALALQPGASVAFPAFHCGAELVPLLELGIPVRYYGVGPTLQVDPDAVREAIDERTAVVFVTQNLGFPQRRMAELRELCTERGLRLLEDCAHALGGRHGDRLLGTYGDVAVFSMRKLLPLPDGSALVINAPDVSAPEPPAPPPAASVLAGAALRVGRRLAEDGGALGGLVRTCIGAPAGALRGRQASSAASDPPPFHAERVGRGMSRLSERILRSTDLVAMARRRREHFAWLLEHLPRRERARPLLDELPEGACPLMFPLVADDPDGLIRHLARHGVDSEAYWRYTHPGFPAADFPHEARLKHRLLTLPVHQNLDRSALESMAAALASWRG